MINIGQICKINDALWICTISLCLVRPDNGCHCFMLCHLIFLCLGSSFFLFISSFLIGWQGRCLKLALMFSARAPLSASSEKSPYLLPIIPAKQHLTNAGTESYPITAWIIHFVSSRYGFLIKFGKCMYKKVYILYIHVVKHLY